MISLLFSGATLAAKSLHIPILVYHNFNPTTPGSMNLTPERLQSQVKWLIDNGYTVIPLKDAVAYLQGKRDTLPSKPVVITADDGWASDYHYLYPLAQKYHIPVTLFIYPETISSGKHALTWAQLKEMQQTGLFDIQAHTYSHPNFKQAKRHMSAENYVKFVNNELFHSKQILEEKMGTPVTLLAWPFGIYDPYLESVAKEAGYEMAFSIDARQADRDFRPMAQPRFMIVASESPQYFEAIVK
jgi:peptidoglycan/xylan/chitin deacetylase (PgdA/CDA1 family)